MCFFFFQAEDGIRDADVTGVQTCALPISCRSTAGGITGTTSRIIQRGSLRCSPALPELRIASDRKSVVEGKSVDLGGRRIIKKKKNTLRQRQLLASSEQTSVCRD